MCNTCKNGLRHALLAKWVAKLREMKTDEKLLLLKTNMKAGHGGSSGRFEYLKEIALDYAFLFKMENIIE